MLPRLSILTVLASLAFVAGIAGQSVAQDAPSTESASKPTRSPTAPVTIAPETDPPTTHPPVRFADISTKGPSGPQVKTIGGLRPRGPERAKVTIVGRPNQKARIVGEDGTVELLERRAILPSLTTTPSRRRAYRSNQVEQSYKRQELRERLDIQPSVRRKTASGAVRPRAKSTPPPARHHSPNSPKRPTAPERDLDER